MMKFGQVGLNILKCKIESPELRKTSILKQTDFTRKRKMGFVNLIHYNINKKGLCTNMETNNFYEKTGQVVTISSQALLDQRQKLNPIVFEELNRTYLVEFYKNFKKDVKTYKDYLLKAIDGSDVEIPNTGKSKEIFGVAKSKSDSIARATISTSYDLLNHYVTDGIIERFRTDEIKMATSHMEKDKEITGEYKSIYIMDRNYVSISFMSYMLKNNIKFLSRLKASSHYIEETGKMMSNDEIVELKHTKSRMSKSRFQDEEVRNYAKNKGSTRVRILKYKLNTGEIEYLVTNLEDFKYEEIVALYEKRWGIETLYFSLKSKLQIEKFTSSIKLIIEQDFFCSILVYNITQTFKNEATETIEQGKYKHEMKINENVAIGLLKNDMIKILLENDDDKRTNLYNKLADKIAKYKIPIRKDRKFPMKSKTDNNNSFNKLKSY